MGISTFLHVLTKQEQDLVALLPDDIINDLCSKLCDRPCVGYDQNTKNTVDVVTTVRELLEDFQPSLNENSKICYMECSGSKFWKATLEHPGSLRIDYGKIGTSGSCTWHEKYDAEEHMQKKIKEKLRKGYRIVNKDEAKVKKALAFIDKLSLSGGKKRACTSSNLDSAPLAKKIKRTSEPVTRGELSRMNKEELIAALEARGCDTTGSIRDLKQRLKDYTGGGDSSSASSSMAPSSEKILENEVEVPVIAKDTRLKLRADLDKAGALVGYLLSKVTGISVGSSSQDEHLAPVLPLRSAGEDVCYGPVSLATPDDVKKLAQAVENFEVASAEALFENPSKMGCLGGLAEVTKDDKEYGMIHLKSVLALLKHARELNCGFLIHFW